MKHFLKIFLGLTLATALFAENESGNTSPIIENETAQVAENSTSEASPEKSNPLLADVAPVVDENTDEASNDTPLEDIRDLRPAVALPMGIGQLIAILCAFVALLIALIYAIRKHRHHRQSISIIPPDPYHKALQELESALQLIQQIDQRPFATGLTDAVRGYLAAVFSLPAPECTTEEVLEQLPNIALLTEEIQQNIILLLKQCDLAKFTKIQFDQPDRLKLYHQAKEFIQSADKLIQLKNVNTTEK